MELDRRWRSTCRIVLGEEVGALSDYGKWLSERADRAFHSKSTASGKEVTYSIDEYCKDSHRISFEEIDFGRKAEPLPINDIKDIDSISNSLAERFSYAGNLILGNSKCIEKSANVSDSHYVYNSSQIGDSKYIAYASMGRQCDHIFGSSAPGNSSFLISCIDTYFVQRAFELWMTANAADCHYVFAINDCSECMFSFNLRGKRHCIGNVQLPKEKYLQIKHSLLLQMREELEAKKRLPSLSDILAKCSDHSSEARALLAGKLPAKDAEKGSMEPIEEAFSRTSEILLDTRLSGLQDYKGWLLKRLRKGERRKSVLSGRDLFVADYAKYLELPKSRAILDVEAQQLVGLSPPARNIEGIMLANAHEYIGNIGYIPLKYAVGSNVNMIDCMTYADSLNCLQCAPCVKMKDSAYNWWPRTSEHLFGCGMVFDSAFCVHCYQSVKLQRCFEVDSSRDCADCFFCHNCENVQNGLFCFNAKNLKYAIGNVEVGREKFAQAKAALMRRIVPALEAGKMPGIDIFSIACASGRKNQPCPK